VLVTVATDSVLVTVCVPMVTVAYDVLVGSCVVYVMSSVLTTVWPGADETDTSVSVAVCTIVEVTIVPNQLSIDDHRMNKVYL